MLKVLADTSSSRTTPETYSDDSGSSSSVAHEALDYYHPPQVNCSSRQAKLTVRHGESRTCAPLLLAREAQEEALRYTGPVGPSSSIPVRKVEAQLSPGDKRPKVNGTEGSVLWRAYNAWV